MDDSPAPTESVEARVNRKGKLYGLDLFSGIGGLSLALEPWVQTVAYCERDLYAQGVLLSRMCAGELDAAPIWDDVTTLRGRDLPPIDIIFGGFPCQDISVAGNGEGLDGKRSGLFFEIVRLAEETKPQYLFLENVPAIRTRGLDAVVEALAKLGYDCRWTTLSAEEVGAPHKRNRWFLLAKRTDASSERQQEHAQRNGEEPQSSGQPRSHVDGLRDALPDAGSEQLRVEQGRGGGPSREGRSFPGVDGSTGSLGENFWATESGFQRVADGVPNRVDRLRCLGNSVVALQAQVAFAHLAGLT